MRRTAPLLIGLALTACAVSIGNESSGRSGEFTSEDRAVIARVLEVQADAWNRGDLEGFMDGYWNDPDLVFTSGARVQRGWDITLERYRATYGESPETMGRLSFSDLEVYALQPDAAWVLGRWYLDRGGDEVGGVFTLVFRRIRGEWKIVHDHTSVGEP
ncbi:MAG TPA: DUF4440 domain-containing protein [Gemmatimonadota bacterium]|nr:DUF4440 domain-containing protein [Gemmatimonadota bacterium]